MSIKRRTTFVRELVSWRDKDSRWQFIAGMVGLQALSFGFKFKQIQSSLNQVTGCPATCEKVNLPQRNSSPQLISE